MAWRGLIEEYREHLPVSASTQVITLLEGDTPLLEAPRISQRVGARVLLKIEGANPTGSFKDRGMTMAITKAHEEGAKAVVCASTGNTSASAAAYAARAGMTSAVLIPDGAIALGKLAQALGVTIKHNGLALDRPPFELRARVGKPEIITGPRIGITKAVDAPWRYGLKGSRFLSKPFK